MEVICKGGIELLRRSIKRRLIRVRRAVDDVPSHFEEKLPDSCLAVFGFDEFENGMAQIGGDHVRLMTRPCDQRRDLRDTVRRDHVMNFSHCRRLPGTGHIFGEPFVNPRGHAADVVRGPRDNLERKNVTQLMGDLAREAATAVLVRARTRTKVPSC